MVKKAHMTDQPPMDETVNTATSVNGSLARGKGHHQALDSAMDTELEQDQPARTATSARDCV